MLVILSPAKKLDLTPREVPFPLEAPQFQKEAITLAQEARALGPQGLRRLMKISDALAELNHDRFLAFAPEPDASQVHPALHAFAGDTYTGLAAHSLSPDALEWARAHLRILSGLYGLLRPFDAMQPYRLEMGSRLQTSRGKTLYEYWGTRIAAAVNEAVAAAGSTALVNCASQEYFGAVQRDVLTCRVVTPVFLDQRDVEAPKVISFHAKKARGAMARFILEHRLTDPDTLTEFDTAGYRHAPELSQKDRPAFLRQS